MAKIPKETIKGFKVVLPNGKSKHNDFLFEVGKTYKHNGEVQLCGAGFHFSQRPVDCFNYYNFDSANLVYEIEASGTFEHDDDKSVCSEISIIRLIAWADVLSLVNMGKGNTGHSNTGYSNTGNSNTGYSNTGDRNTGYRNTGDSNTGYRNTGDRNTGNSNTGNWNTGNWNTGDRNTGDRNTGYSNTGDSNTGDRNTGNSNTGYSNTGYSNTGDRNTGYRNTGYRNTGNSNTGNWNTGYSNTGDRNTGDRNTGDSNTGDRNTGDSNTGYRNTGNSNTGDRNTGYRNTGNWNTGNRNTGYRNTGNSNTGNWNTGNSNTGYSNTGDRNTGAFCAKEPPFFLFDKKCKMTHEQFVNSLAYRRLCDVDTKMWVPSSLMTEAEKLAYPSHVTAEGYMRDVPYKEAFQAQWQWWDSESRAAFTSLENFDADAFFEITGVDLRTTK